MAATAQIKSGQQVLDLACGTGVLTRKVASIVGATGSVVGLDINPGMLSVAGELAPEIEWKLGAAESLPFPDNYFDTIVSQFGLMFFENKEKAIKEMTRVLTPGGRFAIAVWESLENTPAYAAEVELLQQEMGQKAADVLRAPFALGNRDEFIGLFSGIGIKSIGISTHQGTAHFPSIQSMIESDLRIWLPVMGITPTEIQIERMLDKARHTHKQYIQANGSVKFDSHAHIAVGVKL